jgi:hypothetical protein
MSNVLKLAQQSLKLVSQLSQHPDDRHHRPIESLNAAYTTAVSEPPFDDECDGYVVISESEVKVQSIMDL